MSRAMSRVIADISASLDSCFAGPEDGPGPNPAIEPEPGRVVLSVGVTHIFHRVLP